MINTVRAGVTVALLLILAGCHRDRDALQQYLAVDHPRLTAGAAAAIDRFQAILAGEDERPTKLQRLRTEVIGPYSEVVKRLEGYDAGRAVVRRHHDAYLDAARRQLHAFDKAAEALEAGRSLEGAAGILSVTRTDFERWLLQVRAEAQELGVRLTEPAS